MAIDTSYILRCVEALEWSVDQLGTMQRQDDERYYDICRAGSIKEFEIILEQSNRLLRKCLLPYFPSKNKVDALTFKDVYREAGHHSILTMEEVERWLTYRENRNNTSHDYGVQFAEQTLTLLPQFITDVRALVAAIEKINAAETKG